MKPLFRALILIVLAMHGIGHIMPTVASWFPGLTQWPRFAGTSWLFVGKSIASPIGVIFGLFALAVLVSFLVGVYGSWTQQAWARLVLIASAVASIVVIVPWVNVWPQGNVFGALLVDALVLVVLLPRQVKLVAAHAQ
jgi:hypothetical protein